MAATSDLNMKRLGVSVIGGKQWYRKLKDTEDGLFTEDPFVEIVDLIIVNWNII